MADSQASLLVEQVRSGATASFSSWRPTGSCRCPPEELIPLQVELARGRRPRVWPDAPRTPCAALDARLLGPFLERQAGEEVLAFFAAERSHPVLIEAILRRRDVPRPLLARARAPRLPPDLQEILLLRQDAIIEEPAILEALEENPQLSPYTPAPHRRVPRAPAAARAAGCAPPRRREIEEMDEADLAAAIDTRARSSCRPRARWRSQTGLSEGQIRLLPIPARLQAVARRHRAAARRSCCATSNAQVALSVVLNNTLSEQEVEQTRAQPLRGRGGPGRHRQEARVGLQATIVPRRWCRTPARRCRSALRLVPRMAVRDLRDLGRDAMFPTRCARRPCVCIESSRQ